MNTQETHWWLVYGEFRSGTGNLPHFGNVVSMTWPLRFASLQEFADAYGCTVRYARMLGSDNNVDHPKDPNKRNLLANILKVTPLLFGVPVVSSEGNRTVIEFIEKQHMMAYEDILATSWQLFYTGDFQAATKNVSLWLYLLEHSVSEATGVGRDQLLAVQSKFLQLSATSLRDRGAVNAALQEISKAVKIAEEIGNPELLVTSLHHRYRVYVQREEWDKSLIDVKRALGIIHDVGVSDIVKGTIYVDAGEVYTMLAKYDKSGGPLAMKYFDKAAHLARVSEIPDDPTSDIRFGMARVMLERAAAASFFGMSQDAHNNITIAHSMRHVGNIRWLKDALLSEADIKKDEGDIDGCATLVADSIALHKATNSKSNLAWMRRLYVGLADWEPNNSQVQQLGYNLNQL